MSSIILDPTPQPPDVDNSTTGETVKRGNSRQWMDLCGMGLSATCGVHCLLTPLLLILAPALAKHWVHPSVHLILAFIVAPLVLVVTGLGYRKHKRRWVLAAAWAGVALILLALWPTAPTTAQAMDGGQVSATQAHHCSGCAVHAANSTESPAPASTSTTSTTGSASPQTLLSSAQPVAAGLSWPSLNRHSALTLLGGLLLIAAHAGNVWRTASVSVGGAGSACSRCNPS